MIPAIMNWSGGKDSAMALGRLLRNPEYRISSLLTTLSVSTRRVSMHGVREELLRAQADSLGIPLKTAYLRESDGLDKYNALMRKILQDFSLEGITHAAFGDIFLEDLREYRELQLKRAGFSALFPLWGISTQNLIRHFIEDGFKTIVTCVNEQYLDSGFVGRIIDEQFLNDLPEGVDPCGENGEFHTFVFDGPLFREPVRFEPGEKVYKEYKTDSTEPSAYGFWFCDLVPE